MILCIKLYFSQKIILKRYVYLPYLNFSDPLPETHLFFIWPQRKSSLFAIQTNFWRIPALKTNILFKEKKEKSVCSFTVH